MKKKGWIVVLVLVLLLGLGAGGYFLLSGNPAAAVRLPYMCSL